MKRQLYRVDYEYQSEKTENPDRWYKQRDYLWGQNETEARKTFDSVHLDTTYREKIIQVNPVPGSLNLED